MNLRGLNDAASGPQVAVETCVTVAGSCTTPSFLSRYDLSPSDMTVSAITTRVEIAEPFKRMLS